MVLDSKRLLTDLYTFLDANKNNEVTLSEVLHGFMKLFDTFGVHIKPKFALIMGYISEIIKVSAPEDIKIPKRKLIFLFKLFILFKKNKFFLFKVDDMVAKMTKELQTFPHGLTALTKIQNFSRGGMDFERLIKTQGFGYSIDTRLLAWGVLRYMDKNLDMYVSPHEFADALIAKLRLFGFDIDSELSDNLEAFDEMMEKSTHVLLEKYGVIDASQCKSVSFFLYLKLYLWFF